MKNEKYCIGNYEEFPTRIGQEIIVQGKKLAVFKLSTGEIKAISNVCPHKEGPLAEGTVSGSYVFCPLHDYKISLVDGLVQEPDEGCVETFDVIVEDQQVFVVI